MHFLRKDAAILVGCFVFAMALLAPPAIHGDEWNLATRFKVNQTTEVPGLILQSDTPYVIRLLDSPAERHVVQVYNADQTRMLTMFMAISDQRAEPAEDTVFTFVETAPGYPMPIKEWFYPGRTTGLEFIYSKKQAKEIALHAREPIIYGTPGDLHKMAALTVEANQPGKELPATTTASVAKLETPPAPITEEKPSAPAEPPPVVSNDPAAQEPAPVVQDNTESTTNANTTTEPATAQQSNDSESHTLPRTAGELPLIIMIGALCLGAGLGMKLLFQKS